MGCISSKQARCRDRRGKLPLLPNFRSYSLPVHHRGPSSGRVGDSQRGVATLTSSTLGSLSVTISDDDDDEFMMKISHDGMTKYTKDVVDKDNAWSEMIDNRIPKTIARASMDDDDEPETINAWELMAGLEDQATPTTQSPRPLRMQIGTGDSIISDFDPDIISTFRKALDQLSPQHQLLLRSPEPDRAKFVRLSPLPEKPVKKKDLDQADVLKFPGIVKARITAFQEKIDAKRSKKCPPHGERKVVYYFTSLRGVRKTYEDCRDTRVILQGYGVKVDERDVSMHGGFKDELSEILGAAFRGSRLPRAFANGKYLGGAEEVRQMHEDGDLAEALRECEAVAAEGGGGACDACGDMRFVLCEVCSGSCKVFVEGGEEGEGDFVSGFRRCPDCNENGLVRCPVCC